MHWAAERLDMRKGATATRMTLHLSRCQYAQAFDAADQLIAADRGADSSQAWSVLIEAGTRLGRHDAAQRALSELTRRASAGGTTWALGVLALGRALLAGDGEAADLYEQSIALLDAAGVLSERARARLLYGEWLRRQRRRTAARNWLTAASQLFRQVGAPEFAHRAQRELDATMPAGRRDEGLSLPSSVPRLTLTERRVAELAATGATNREIAVELFVSRRTVDHHLRNTYGKLGVRSRRQLGAVLPGHPPELWRPASHPSAAGGELTDRELQIARLAAAGVTNRGIGSQLFIQATTVDYHLQKIYRKLGVSSRRALSGLGVSADSPGLSPS
jgi:ATP/maltotriose-dependent transcriptional regulator MalT